jgi:O-antigen/teichoic acid export membrane protein
VVSVSMLVSGALIYAFHAGAARALGPEQYGKIAVLWAAMFLGVIVLFRPLEQATSRSIADRHARGEETRSVIRSVSLLAAVVLAALVPAFALAWNFVTDRLFGGSDVMTALLAVGIASYGVAYVARGVVAGARWFAGYGLGLVADSVARLLIAVPLLFAASLNVAAAAVTVAGLVGGVAPLVIGRRRLAPVAAGGAGSEFRLRRALRFAAPASAIAAADQLLVNCSPLLVMAEGGSTRAAGLVFAATMLVRVPTYVFQGLAATILPNLTRLHAGEHADGFRRATLETAAVLLGAGAAVVAFAALVGPEALRIVYGPDFEAGRLPLAALGAGVGFYLAATTFSQALLALGASARSAAVWVTAAVLFVGLYFGLGGSELERVSVAFACATFVKLCLLSVILQRRVRTR